MATRPSTSRTRASAEPRLRVLAVHPLAVGQEPDQHWRTRPPGHPVVQRLGAGPEAGAGAAYFFFSALIRFKRSSRAGVRLSPIPDRYAPMASVLSPAAS